MYSFESHQKIEEYEFWSYRPLYKKKKKVCSGIDVHVCLYVCVYVYVHEMIGLEEQPLCSTSYSHTSLSQTRAFSWHSRIIHVFVLKMNLRSQFLTFPGVMAGVPDWSWGNGTTWAHLSRMNELWTQVVEVRWLQGVIISSRNLKHI